MSLTSPRRDWLLRRLLPLWRIIPTWLQWRLMWLVNAKFSLGVTGIVFDDRGRVMLLKHTFRHAYPWGLVSGWVMRGETLHQALQREVAEETSLTVQIGPLFRVRQDRRRFSVEVVYLCRLLGGVFRPNNEITAIRWCPLDELPPGVHPEHYPLIREAARFAARGVSSPVGVASGE
ncbi:MAG TPA: NUDIX hydrolase [Chloroflexota bacterium]|nr:NUDIX hydrolase [Chloroflexota bacterium]